MGLDLMSSGKEFHILGPWQVKVNFLMLVLDCCGLKSLLCLVAYEWKLDDWENKLLKDFGMQLFVKIEYINSPICKE